MMGNYKSKYTMLHKMRVGISDFMEFQTQSQDIKTDIADIS